MIDENRKVILDRSIDVSVEERFKSPRRRSYMVEIIDITLRDIDKYKRLLKEAEENIWQYCFELVSSMEDDDKLGLLHVVNGKVFETSYRQSNGKRLEIAKIEEVE